MNIPFGTAEYPIKINLLAVWEGIKWLLNKIKRRTMCWKKIAEWFKPEPIEIPNYGDNTVGSIVVGDYAGTANDLAGPPHDQVDFQKMLLAKWPHYTFRMFKDAESTTERFLAELRAAVKDLPDDGMLLFIMDNCSSDTNTRNHGIHPTVAKRFHPPTEPIDGNVTKKILKTQEFPRVLVISACLANQTAADAVFDGRTNGALHYCLIKSAEKGITYAEWVLRAKAMLIKFGFDQRPTIDGPVELQNRKIFEGKVRVIQVSSHGTYVKDTSGDEADGRDEALYLYNGTVIDDEIGAILSTLG